MSENNGMDDRSTAMSLARNLLMQCDDDKADITLPKGTLKIILTAFLGAWHQQQDVARSGYKKAAE